MKEETIKHLEFIQNIITRMNTNSFQIKAMSLSLVSALLAVYATTQQVDIIIICIFPISIFWILDAYYLSQERKFRGLYNDLVMNNNPHKLKPFEINTTNYKGNKYSISSTLFSITIWTLYIPSTILIVGLYFYLK